MKLCEKIDKEHSTSPPLSEQQSQFLCTFYAPGNGEGGGGLKEMQSVTPLTHFKRA